MSQLRISGTVAQLLAKMHAEEPAGTAAVGHDVRDRFAGRS